MDLKFVETLVSVLERSKALSEIEYSDGQRHVTLKRASSGTTVSATPFDHPLAEARTLDRIPAAVEHPAAASIAAAPNTHTIVAGMIGTFYRSPAPNQPAFVSVGDSVKEGQTLAIVEAMKLLNPIDADRAGRVSEILVADGTAVGADTPLFVIEDLEASNV
ncbi:acetyl-CoA carboxylase biotin carboxyl carrier protein [Cupriavidus pauculus]|uniref:acetyl-CoA carboxylase biotin carboxyl carrier protein n=1 Tax=Cupriavidus pauculus TaxID=82633 RepID=UPI0020845C2B|nr:acetyl-CoA carboxylase biotin carboxyl carrier protein [Cupriavidus pauculus]GJG97707.1 acetyl-CoA carboxylase biotin carboxyl carrier protein [Cupriavidus pauculus]